MLISRVTNWFKIAKRFEKNDLRFPRLTSPEPRPGGKQTSSCPGAAERKKFKMKKLCTLAYLFPRRAWWCRKPELIFLSTVWYTTYRKVLNRHARNVSIIQTGNYTKNIPRAFSSLIDAASSPFPPSRRRWQIWRRWRHPRLCLDGRRWPLGTGSRCNLPGLGLRP